MLQGPVPVLPPSKQAFQDHEVPKYRSKAVLDQAVVVTQSMQHSKLNLDQAVVEEHLRQNEAVVAVLRDFAGSDTFSTPTLFYVFGPVGASYRQTCRMPDNA